jgi:release factor glutamine methyltransferase
MLNNLIQKLLLEKRKYGLKEKISNKEIKMLKKDFPIQKIIGFINFDDVYINLKYNVLIPRYETEEVMLESLKYINSNSKVLDLCTGSGYIGLSIKKKINANVTLSDISKDSIKQAKKNSKINKLKVKIIKSNMFENINEKYDLIISNPPYIPNHIKLSKSILKFEPFNALFGGKDGNNFYKIIIQNVSKYLRKNGILILEISKDNLKYVKSFGFKIKNDINNKPRIAIKKFNVL